MLWFDIQVIRVKLFASFECMSEGQISHSLIIKYQTKFFDVLFMILQNEANVHLYQRQSKLKNPEP